MKEYLAISSGLGLVGHSRKNSSTPKVLAIAVIIAVAALLLLRL